MSVDCQKLKALNFLDNCEQILASAVSAFKLQYLHVQRMPHQPYLAGFHVGALTWSNWNLECWVLGRKENGRIRESEQHPWSTARANKLNPHILTSCWNRTWGHIGARHVL